MSKKDAAKKQKETAPVLPQRSWPKGVSIEISAEAMNKPGRRVAYFSRLDAESEGFRMGLILLAATIMAQEGCNFPVFAGGIISKEWFQQEIRRRIAELNIPKKFHAAVVENLRDDLIGCIKSAVPLIKKSDGTLIKWYIMPSMPHDGDVGEEILRRLQELRPDIRRYALGGEKIEVICEDNSKIYHGVVLPKRRRLPSKYMSPGPERDIQDIEDQTSRAFPHIWIYGTPGTAIYKPRGEREVPYITLPVIHRLEAQAKRIAENQVGFTIIEDKPDGDRLVHFWNLRDIVAREREFITKIKKRATPLQRRIIDVIKREGPRHIGRLADDLDADREMIAAAIAPLVKEKNTIQDTWPWLRYDPRSDRYDFHPEWIQRKLAYALPQNGQWREDSFLFFGCLHAGYTTTDYEYVVKKFPENILKYDIQVLVGVGDFIAGLRHSFMHTGEILDMNNTEQEQFAAELMASIIYRVFTKRFIAMRAALGSAPSDNEVRDLIGASLMLFLGIKGNHDLWQEQDGNTALAEFYGRLCSILISHIQPFLARAGFGAISAEPIIRKKILLLPEHRPVYTLPSGIKVGLIHPHMARAGTTSLRAEAAMELFLRQWQCHVVGIANFHTAVFAHKWTPRVGQCVAVQSGTQVLSTTFEHHKLKTVDFGPQLLIVRSCEGRIYKTTLAAFTEPILQDPIAKDTNVNDLKHRLGLLGY